MIAYYNEFNPCAAQWLRNLIETGMIVPGEVDERSITDVRADDLRGFTQCHFFAGIGGWSYALRLAEWPDDRPVWTGSAPCQPWSVAGKWGGADDDRHLWPHMSRLIAARKPEIVFGEQVPNAIRLGWLDGIQGDLEAEGYTVGSIVLGAHSVGSPQIRQRLYWGALRKSGRVENTDHEGLEGFPGSIDEQHKPGRELPRQIRRPSSEAGVPAIERMANRNIIHANGKRYGASHDGRELDRTETISGIQIDGMADSNHERDNWSGKKRIETGRGESPINCWSNFELVQFPDGTIRRTQCGVYPVAHGLPPRMGRDCSGAEGTAPPNRRAIIEGFGNAIVPRVAAEFINAFSECTKYGIQESTYM